LLSLLYIFDLLSLPSIHFSQLYAFLYLCSPWQNNSNPICNHCLTNHKRTALTKLVNIIWNNNSIARLLPSAYLSYSPHLYSLLTSDNILLWLYVSVIISCCDDILLWWYINIIIYYWDNINYFSDILF
jgi:hypothetical protein